MTTNRIEINPKVMMGKPVIRGTRIPVELILRKSVKVPPNLIYSLPTLGSLKPTSKPLLAMPPIPWLMKKQCWWVLLLASEPSASSCAFSLMRAGISPWLKPFDLQATTYLRLQNWQAAWKTRL